MSALALALAQGRARRRCARVVASVSNADLTTRLLRLAHECGDEEVRAWIARHITEDAKRARTRRKRGIRVRLARVNREVVLDAERVAALADD